VLKILSFNLLIISFVLVSCSKSENETPTNTAVTYPTSKSGVTASGTMTVGSDTVSGTYAYACSRLISGGPSDATHVGWILVITGSSSFTEESNYYTDSACTSLSYGRYDNFDNVTVGEASGSDYKVTYTLTNYTLFANTTEAKTYIEGVFSGITVTVGTAYVITSGMSYKNLIKVSGTNLDLGNESLTDYPSTSDGNNYVKQ
jgi:hypothetical protein